MSSIAWRMDGGWKGLTHENRAGKRHRVVDRSSKAKRREGRCTRCRSANAALAVNVSRAQLGSFLGNKALPCCRLALCPIIAEATGQAQEIRNGKELAECFRKRVKNFRTSKVKFMANFLISQWLTSAQSWIENSSEDS